MKVIVVEHSFTASLAGGSDRGEPLFSTKPEGTGLGLAIAKRIAAAHRGRVSIASTEGEGTRVVDDLPR